MIRHYLIAKTIEDITRVETELLEMGLDANQIQVLSDEPSMSALHKVREVDSLSRRDIIRSGLIGAGIGAVAAGIILGVGAYFGANSAESWLPFGFLAFFALCFGAWEGGLFGIQISNVQFRKFEKLLKKGHFVLLVDVQKIEDEKVKALVKAHPELQDGGYGKPKPSWLISSQKNVESIIKTLP